jgi:hypothetical protein
MVEPESGRDLGVTLGVVGRTPETPVPSMHSIVNMAIDDFQAKNGLKCDSSAM